MVKVIDMLDRDLFELIKGKGKYIGIAVVASLFSLIMNLAITASICLALNYAIKGEVAKLVIPACIAIIAILIRLWINIFAGRTKADLGAGIKADLRAKTYDKILKLGVRTSEEMSMAGLTQVSMEGIEQLDLYYTSYLPQFFYSMIAPIILFIITVFIDWKTALMLLCCVPLIPISIVAVSKYAKKIFAKYWGKYTSMGDYFLDSVQGLKELKIFKADKRYHERMNDKAEEFRKITMKVLVMQLASTTIMDFIAFGGAGAGIAIAISSVVSGAISPLAGLFLVLVAVEFFLPLRALGSAFHIAMNGASAGKKIKALLEAEEPQWGDQLIDDENQNSSAGVEKNINSDIEKSAKIIEQSENKKQKNDINQNSCASVEDKEKYNNICIDFEDVTFSYDGDKKVLQGLNLTIENNKITAIAGESGCGKSTIVGLISGALRAESGQIRVKNKLINSLSRENYYSHLAVVSYNTYIFNDTIGNNFLLAKKDVSEQQIYDALSKVNLLDFVMQNGGLDKVINEDAGNISGGQKQRLATAVNLVAGKSIYVFDEATSNIDIESEAIIMKNIVELSQKATVVIISHRLANIVGAHKIYYLKDGKVKEAGTHAQLCEKQGDYYKLYTQQKNLEQGYLKDNLNSESQKVCDRNFDKDNQIESLTAKQSKSNNCNTEKSADNKSCKGIAKADNAINADSDKGSLKNGGRI